MIDPFGIEILMDKPTFPVSPSPVSPVILQVILIFGLKYSNPSKRTHLYRTNLNCFHMHISSLKFFRYISTLRPRTGYRPLEESRGTEDVPSSDLATNRATPQGWFMMVYASRLLRHMNLSFQVAIHQKNVEKTSVYLRTYHP